jgi:hypothetical protein
MTSRKPSFEYTPLFFAMANKRRRAYNTSGLRNQKAKPSNTTDPPQAHAAAESNDIADKSEMTWQSHTYKSGVLIFLEWERNAHLCAPGKMIHAAWHDFSVNRMTSQIRSPCLKQL